MKMQIILAVVAFVVTAGSSIGAQVLFAPDPPPPVSVEEMADGGHGEEHGEEHGGEHGVEHGEGHGEGHGHDEGQGHEDEHDHGEKHGDNQATTVDRQDQHDENQGDFKGEGQEDGQGDGQEEADGASLGDDHQENQPKDHATASKGDDHGDGHKTRAKSDEPANPTGHISPRRKVEKNPEKYGEGIDMPESPVLVFNEMGGVLGSMSPDDAAAFISHVTDERAIAILRAMRLREARKILMALPRKRANELREKMLDITKKP